MVNNEKINMATINEFAMIVFLKTYYRVFLVSFIHHNTFA